MPDVYLTPRRGPLFGTYRTCFVCAPDAPLRHRARAYQHPNPLRSAVIVWRCRRHAKLRFVPVDAKQGLGGGVYR